MKLILFPLSLFHSNNRTGIATSFLTFYSNSGVSSLSPLHPQVILTVSEISVCLFSTSVCTCDWGISGWGSGRKYSVGLGVLGI